MPISDKYKCLFVHIPKTAGTSIENALGIFGDWKIEDQNSLFGLVQSKELKEHNFLSNFLQHLTYSQCNLVKPLPDSYTSFSFVRNPWDKMVSIYSNPDNNLVHEAKQQGIKIKELSFEDFIYQTNNIDHIHLEHQHRFICNEKNKIAVNFVGKFETLQKDFKILCSMLNIDPTLPHQNKSNHTNYREYYNEELMNIIGKRYAKDIQLFDYTF